MKALNSPKIYFIHLLNDFSGSPKVLSQVIDIFIDSNFDLEIYTSNTSGFLSSKQAKYNYFSYTWSPFKILTLFRLIRVQLIVIFQLLFKLNKSDIIYVNTLLPFGAALVGKLKGSKVIYHIHETSIKPPILKKILKYVAQKSASKAIYVSKYLLQQEPLANVNCSVIYNALESKFIKEAQNHISENKDSFTILMLCSLKKYKGVDVFLELSRRLPNFNFNLVVNSYQNDIDSYFMDQQIPENIQIFPVQKNVHTFYKKANLVMNLSDPELWVETFGLTAIEAFAYKIPVIVPPIGGIAEVVSNNSNGFHMDMNHLEEIILKVREIASNKIVYDQLCQSAGIRALDFYPEKFTTAIKTLVED